MSEAEKIVIDLTNLDSQVYSEQDSQTSLRLQRDAYQTLLDHLRTMHQNLNDRKMKHITECRTHNAILIHAGRGMGKTLFLINIENQLRLLDKEADGQTQIFDKLLILKPIDPTVLDNDENFLTVVIAKILNHLENIDTFRNGNDEKFNKALRELAHAIDAIIEPTEHLSAIERIAQDQSSLKLEQQLHDFFKLVTEITGKSMILLQIDDIDMQIDKGFEILEVIRRFLASPYIVPIITGDNDQYQMIVEKNFVDKLTPLSFRQDVETLKDYRKSSKELAQKYLTKVFPVFNRVELQTLYNLFNVNQNIKDIIQFKYEDYYKLNELYSMLLEQEGIDEKEYSDLIEFENLLTSNFRSIFQFYRSLFSYVDSNLNKVDSLYEAYGRIDKRLDPYGLQIQKYDHEEYQYGLKLKSEGDLKGASEKFKQAFDRQPKYQYFEALFDTFNDLKNHTEMQKLLKDNKHRFANDSEWRPEFLANLYGKLGDLYALNKRFEAAINIYDQALSIKSANIAILISKGNAYDNLKDSPNAIKCYKSVLNIEPSHYEAMNSLGISYLYLGEFDLAIKTIKEAQEIKPDSSLAFYNLGVAFSWKEQYKEAVFELEQALDLDPQNFEILVYLGRVHKEMQSYEQAIRAYETALQLRPENWILEELGFLHEKNGDEHVALQYYSKAFQSSPTAKIAITMGNLHKRLSQYALAIAAYDFAIEVDPQNFAALFNKALCFQKSKEYVEAFDAFLDALRVRPKADDVMGYIAEVFLQLDEHDYNLKILLEEFLHIINKNYKEKQLDTLIDLHDKVQNNELKIELEEFFESKVANNKVRGKARLSAIAEIVANAEKSS